MNKLVKSIRLLRTLTPSDFKLAVQLARPEPLKPGPRKVQAKPIRRRRKARIEPKVEAE